MRRLIIALCVAMVPAIAWAEPQITGVDLETTEPEVRVVVNLDPPMPAPAHRLMRDDNSLRLRFVEVETQGFDEQVEDETLRRVRVVSYRGRVIVRMDPRRSSAVDLLERAEVQPHPRGVVVVLQRSDREIARYRDAHTPPQTEPDAEQVAAQDDTNEEDAADDETMPDEATSEEDATSAMSASTDTPPQPTKAPATPTGVTRRERPRSSTPQATAAMSSDPLRAGVAVAFILILGGVAWYMRRRRGRHGSSGPIRSIDVVAAKRIGPRQSLLLVEAGGQTLLVGTTEKGMVRLATLDDEGARELDDDVHVDADEELAPPRLTNDGRRELTPLERELRRPMNGERVRKPSFTQELESEGARLSGWANLLASRNPKKTGMGIEVPSNSSTAAVEGLLRLRQMADDSTSMAPHSHGTNGRINGHVNGAKPNGKDKNLAALESLLTSRPAN